MPRSGILVSDDASIELVDFQSTYLPEDVILGHVVTKKAFAPGINADKSLVKLRLFGRTKSKIVDKSGNVTSIYRGRAALFEEIQCIFRGAVTAGAKIPFSVTVPRTPQPGFEKRGDSWDEDKDGRQTHPLPVTGLQTTRRYLSTTQEDVTKHKLPGVFYFRDKSAWTGSVYEAFVEYFLEAILTCPNVKDVKAVFPLLIRQQSTEKPLEDLQHSFNMKSSFQIVRSERLLPDARDRKMTFREKSRRIFTPSKTPSYSYTVKVVYPTVIQLEHPEPIPLKIYIVPLLKQLTAINPDGDLRRLPPVDFMSMELKLISNIRLRCPGTLYEHSGDRETAHHIPFQGPTEAFTFTVPAVIRGNLKPPMQQSGDFDKISNKQHSAPPLDGSPYLEEGALRPAVEDAASLEGPIEYTRFQAHEQGEYFLGAPFDLGAHLDIRLSQKGSSTLGHAEVPFEKRIWPSFATYNIVQAYRLAWSIKLSCAGEGHTVGGSADVTVLSPSEEQEARKKRELGQDGMKKNYDDLVSGLDMALGFVEIASDILQAMV
jgi:hypothetical protein